MYLNTSNTIHSSVQNRVVVARFGAINPVTKVTFNSITCDEAGSYTWSASFYEVGGSAETTKTATQQITVKGKRCIIDLVIDLN